jgi:hypothetical protein
LRGDGRVIGPAGLRESGMAVKSARVTNSQIRIASCPLGIGRRRLTTSRHPHASPQHPECGSVAGFEWWLSRCNGHCRDLK